MAENYINGAQQRVLQALLVLAGHEIDGLAPGQIASALGTSASNTTRDLSNLKEAGLAESLESGRWRLTPRIPQIAVAMLNALDRASSRVDEVKQRYTREPK